MLRSVMKSTRTAHGVRVTYPYDTDTLHFVSTPLVKFNFDSQAPAHVVEEARANLQAQQEQLKTVRQSLSDLDS